MMTKFCIAGMTDATDRNSNLFLRKAFLHSATQLPNIWQKEQQRRICAFRGFFALFNRAFHHSSGSTAKCFAKSARKLFFCIYRIPSQCNHLYTALSIKVTMNETIFIEPIETAPEVHSKSAYVERKKNEINLCCIHAQRHCSGCFVMFLYCMNITIYFIQLRWWISLSFLSGCTITFFFCYSSGWKCSHKWWTFHVEEWHKAS